MTEPTKIPIRTVGSTTVQGDNFKPIGALTAAEVLKGFSTQMLIDEIERRKAT